MASVYDSSLRPAAGQQTVLTLPYLPDATVTQLGAMSDAGWTIDSVSWQPAGAGLVVVAASGSVQGVPSRDYTWFAHVLGPNGSLVGQDDHPPLARSVSWRPGDGLAEAFNIPDSRAGTELELGLYDGSGGRALFRLPDGRLVDHLQLPLGVTAASG